MQRFLLMMTILVTPGVDMSTVVAQQPDTTTVAPDSTDQPLPRDVLEAITVTGVLNPAPLNRLGFALSVITRQSLLAEPRLYAVDALRTLPGAFIDEAAGPGGPTIIRLRGGEEVFTQILMDGVQLNENGGFFDFQGYTLTNIDRIEVARGPQSAMYGSSAVSGVVHFITRQGFVGRPRFELTSEGGGATRNGGSFRTTLTASGGSPSLRYSAGGGVTYQRGNYDLPNDTWSRDGSLRIDATASERLDLKGLFRFTHMDGNLPVRDPGATRAPLDPNARNRRNRIATSLHATINPRSQWRHRIGVSVYRDDFQFVDRRDDVTAAQMFDFFIFDATFNFDADLWRTKVDYVGTTGRGLFGNDGGIALSYGAAWEREDLSNVITGEFTGNTSFGRNSVAAFGEIQAQLGSHVSLVAGTRLEKYEDLDADFTPRASVVVEVVPEWLALRGAVGRAFKAPNLQQQFVENPFIASNPNLEPETSVSWEVGGTLTEPTATFVGGATYFHQTYDNLIRSVDLGDGSGKQINRNLGNSLAEGVEVDLHFRATSSVSAGINGTWIRTEIRENVGLPSDQFPVGQELPFRPDFVGSAHLQLDLGERWTGVVRGSYVGGQTVLTERFGGNRADLDGYFIANVTARYQLLQSLSVFGRVGNLFNTSYETAFDRIGSPLTAALGARLVN